MGARRQLSALTHIVTATTTKPAQKSGPYTSTMTGTTASASLSKSIHSTYRSGMLDPVCHTSSAVIASTRRPSNTPRSLIRIPSSVPSFGRTAVDLSATRIGGIHTSHATRFRDRVCLCRTSDNRSATCHSCCLLVSRVLIVSAVAVTTRNSRLEPVTLNFMHGARMRADADVRAHNLALRQVQSPRSSLRRVMVRVSATPFQ